jgi:hypothetical protein
MRLGVIADLMAGGGHLAGDMRQAANVEADLKKGGGGAIAVQDF